jgi:hypothetical protein
LTLDQNPSTYACAEIKSLTLTVTVPTQAFLLMDQTARSEKLGSGLSIQEKEEVLGAAGNQVETIAAAAPAEATEQDNTSAEAKEISPDEPPPSALEEAVAAKAPLAARGVSEEDPVLGQLVADLGDKRVYLASVPQLIRLPVSIHNMTATALSLSDQLRPAPNAPPSIPTARAGRC